MKPILSLAIMCLMSLGAMAQTSKTITGAVIDKNGNPLPGALVEATGGADNVMTDADGTFSIEVPIWLKSLTAKYAGYYNKAISVKNKNNVLFKMSGTKEGNYFINAVYSHFVEDFNYERIGLMGGYLGKWGWYVKALYDFSDDLGISSSVGIIKRLSQPLYLYLGAGFTQYAYEDYHGYYDFFKEDGGIVDLGLIYKTGHLNLNIGGSFTTSLEGNDYYGFAVQASVGYNF